MSSSKRKQQVTSFRDRGKIKEVQNEKGKKSGKNGKREGGSPNGVPHHERERESQHERRGAVFMYYQLKESE